MQKINFKAPYSSIQIPVFRDCTAQNIVYPKGRRAGGTEGEVRRMCRDAVTNYLNKTPTEELWIDTTHRNIVKYVDRKFKPLLRQLPPNAWNWNGANMTLKILGTRIDFGSYLRPELIEGHGYDGITINEAGIVLLNENFYFHTLLPMSIEKKGAKKRFIGAPKGGELFEILYNKGQPDHHSYDPSWASFRHTSYDSPFTSDKEIDEIRLITPEKTFRQEYLAEFLEDAGFFSGLSKLFIGTLQNEPVPAASYVIGVDLAKEVDYTVCWVGRVDTREGVYCERYNKLPWPEQVQRIKNLSQRFTRAHCVVDATGLGDVIVDDLRASGVSVTPYKFNNESKNQMLDDLAADIEQSRIKCYKHGETYSEMKSIQRILLPSGKWRIEAVGGMHDDCVMSLGLMNYGFGRPYIEGSIITGESESSRSGLA